MAKEVKENIEGKPIEITFDIGGQFYEFRLVCPMCGETNFAFSKDKALGGCVNPNCPCICFERIRDCVGEGGISWAL